MIKKHAEYTRSDRAAQVLANWDARVRKFVKVYPNDYRRDPIPETVRSVGLFSHRPL